MYTNTCVAICMYGFINTCIQTLVLLLCMYGFINTCIQTLVLLLCAPAILQEVRTPLVARVGQPPHGEHAGSELKLLVVELALADGRSCPLHRLLGPRPCWFHHLGGLQHLQERRAGCLIVHEVAILDEESGTVLGQLPLVEFGPFHFGGHRELDRLVLLLGVGQPGPLGSLEEGAPMQALEALVLTHDWVLH
jgi:hypothetical protein